jgi:hypothetical protein
MKPRRASSSEDTVPAGLPQLWLLDWMDKIILANSFLSVPEARSYVTRIVQALLVLSVSFVGGLVCLLLSWRRSNHDTDRTNHQASENLGGTYQ